MSGADRFALSLGIRQPPHWYNDPVLDKLILEMERHVQRDLATMSGYAHATLSGFRLGQNPRPNYFMVRDVAAVMGLRLELRRNLS